MAGLATTGMIHRIISDLKLPVIFLSLPVALTVMPVVSRTTSLLADAASRETVTGVLTGVTCSFLSAVGNTHKVQLIALSPWMEQYYPPLSNVLRHMELLFVPVLFLTVILSFSLTFAHFPSGTGIATAAATALSADFTIVTCMVMLRTDDIKGSDVILSMLLLFVPFLLLSLMPLFRDQSRAWILCLMTLFLVIFWEVMFLGSGIWTYSRNIFPTTGCLVGLMYVFHSSYFDPDKQTAIMKLKIGTGTRDRNQLSGPRDRNHLPRGPTSLLVPNSVVWHTLAYGVERVALVRIFQEPHQPSDWLLSCVVLVLFIFIMSRFMDGGLFQRVLAVCCLLFTYLSCSLVNNTLRNSYILDMLLGMTIVCVTNPLPLSGF